MRTFKRWSLALVASSATLLGAVGPASASGSATATEALSVGVVTAPVCTVSAGSALAFAPFSGSAVQANSSILSVTCPSGATATVTLDNGLNWSGANRRMACSACGGTFLAYQIFTSAALSTQWQGATSVGLTGTGSAISESAWGVIMAQTIPPQGGYSDTVTATVSF